MLLIACLGMIIVGLRDLFRDYLDRGDDERGQVTCGWYLKGGGDGFGVKGGKVVLDGWSKVSLTLGFLLKGDGGLVRVWAKERLG